MGNLKNQLTAEFLSNRPALGLGEGPDGIGGRWAARDYPSCRPSCLVALKAANSNLPTL